MGLFGEAATDWQQSLHTCGSLLDEEIHVVTPDKPEDLANSCRVLVSNPDMLGD